MGKRVIIGGLVGGIALFAWGSLWHLALPFASAGIRDIPNEQSVVSVMKASITEPGFYFFPGLGLAPGATRQQQAAAMEAAEKKAATGPNGILVIHPEGGGGLTAARLTTEIVLNLVQATLLALLLACSGGGGTYMGRVGLVTLAGIFGALATNVQYWNWYGFPGYYTVMYMVSEILGFFVTGLVVAAFVRGGGDAAQAARG